MLENFSSLPLNFSLHNLKMTILDQSALPHQEIYLDSSTPEAMVDHIKSLRVRGAPLIGVAAALSLLQYALKHREKSLEEITWVAQLLRKARPTAVNLMNALDFVTSQMKSLDDILPLVTNLVEKEMISSEQMASYGSSLISDGDQILTHCNSGALATVGCGTALGVIIRAHEQKKNIHVWVDETRPLLQGARLTTYELEKAGVPYTLICDNMAAYVMQQKKVDKIFVGADRIAMNGDFANKIGTYSIAVNAYFHKIPFYVVAPSSTIDEKATSGANIPIEERSEIEVKSHAGVLVAPLNASVFNPAFDITPKELVSGWITERGVDNCLSFGAVDRSKWV